MIYKTAWEALGFKSYKEFLESNFWKDKRDTISPSSHQCQMGCGRQAVLVHHLHYNTLGNEKSKDIMVLCWECHKKIHGK